MTGLQLIEFIDESNKIEDVHSLQAIEDSVDAWVYLRNKKRLTLKVILRVHYLIMRRLNKRIAGKTRTELGSDVMVGGRICPTYKVVEDFLNYWVTDANKLKLTEKIIKTLHVDFEQIHPFEDGNGRTGRLLWLWHREKAGLLFKLIQYKDRWRYYEWFD